jgi:hypothetical protein
MESRIRIITTPLKMRNAFQNSKVFTIKYFEKLYENEDGTCEYDAIVRHKELEKPLNCFTLDELKTILK